MNEFKDRMVSAEGWEGMMRPVNVNGMFFADNPDTLVVMLIPARTDTSYFHEYIYNKAELRFVRGRLHFNESPQGAPFPSMVVIFN